AEVGAALPEGEAARVVGTEGLSARMYFQPAQPQPFHRGRELGHGGSSGQRVHPGEAEEDVWVRANRLGDRLVRDAGPASTAAPAQDYRSHVGRPVDRRLLVERLGRDVAAESLHGVLQTGAAGGVEGRTVQVDVNVDRSDHATSPHARSMGEPRAAVNRRWNLARYTAFRTYEKR